ncbi:hypothetical protein D3C71_1775830 [compost metagenome]
MISDRPIRQMMVPVTTGVITLRSLLMNWLKAISTKAAQKQMPNRVERISSSLPPRPLTMNPALRITLRKPKLVPCRHSRPEPIGPMRLAWTKVPRPETNSAMLTR